VTSLYCPYQFDNEGKIVINHHVTSLHLFFQNVFWGLSIFSENKIIHQRHLLHYQMYNVQLSQYLMPAVIKQMPTQGADSYLQS
jgi:hypothetical protein